MLLAKLVPSVLNQYEYLEGFSYLCRNKYVYETMLAVLLAVLVSVLGYWLLLEDFYTDFWIFVFCFVLAGCQFSLLKVRREWWIAIYD